MANKTESPPKNKLRIPIDYLWSVSDAIHQTNPTREIIFNKIKEVFCEGVTKGVFWRLSGAKKFKDKQNTHFKEYWDGLQDYLDDVIHDKAQPKKQ